MKEVRFFCQRMARKPLRFIAKTFIGILLVVYLVFLFICCYAFFGKCIVCFDIGLMSVFWGATTAVAALLAVYYAQKAYDESVQARNADAFYSMFTILIEIQNNIFHDVKLQQTRLAKKSILYYGIKEEESVFYNFVSYYKRCTKGVDLSVEKIVTIWNDFYKLIFYKSEFSKCFKYIYHEIDIILEYYKNLDGNDETSKTNHIRHYAGLIQGGMNKDELFCYFINLLVFFSEHKSDCHSVQPEGGG